MLPTLEISSRAASKLAEGHLWIFSNEVLTKEPNLEPGSWCLFSCQKKIVGTGYFNPHSLIAGRLVSADQREDIKELLEERLTQAFKRRENFFENGSVRLLFSEADFLPGLIIDWYGAFLVLQSNTAGLDGVLTTLES